jgi:small GTP-binding protein
MAGTTSSITSLGERLRQLATDAQRPAVDAVVDRARGQRLRVLVAGEAKRGKSTLINRLLDRDLLPSGVLPVTAISTTVRYGEHDEALVHYLDGHTVSFPLADLSEFVTERHNPGNRLGIDTVEVRLAHRWLDERRLELVDTPGTGSIFTHNTQAAQRAYTGLDAVIMVVTADPPMNAADRELLVQVSANSVRTFLVLNKADQLSADELAETVGFTESVCRTSGVGPSPIFAMSARNADDGFHTFRSQFDEYLSTHGQADTERAIRGHLTRLAGGMRDEAQIERRAIDLGRGQAAKTVAAFRDHLAALSAEAVALDDRCRAAERRLRRELDEHAHEQTRQLTSRARGELSVAFDQLSDDLPAADVEQRGRELLERIVGDAVLAWRAGRAKELERRLAELIASIEAERARQLDSLREHARDELALTLTTGMEPLPLHSGRMFWLDFAPAPAVELPGSQLLRTHGPGAARRARRRVLEDVVSITDRQVGRARSDLQHRLGETVRRTIAAIRVHHVETLDRLREALDRATEMQQRTEPEIDAELARLQARVTALEEIISAAEGRADRAADR